MAVKTTLNIDKKILEQISIASEKMEKSRTDIIIMLLMKVMSYSAEAGAASGPVKYQNAGGVDEWHKFHITFRDDYYDYFTDLRKILKSSLSRLVAVAVKKYLDEIVCGKNSDNTLFQHYIIVKEDSDDVICWKIYWGIPENAENFTTLS